MQTPELSRFTAARPALSALLGDKSVPVLEPAAGELDDAMEAARRDGQRLLPVGSGRRLRPGLPLSDTVALLSSAGMKQIRDLDMPSALIHVEAGATVGAVSQALETRGLTLGHLGALPEEETIGGLLASAYGGNPAYSFHSLHGACVGLTAAFGVGKRYHYIPAPRKASGPDLRHVFLGSEGRAGMITEVWLAAARVPERRQRLRLHGNNADSAVDIIRTLIAGEGVRPWQSELVANDESAELRLELAGNERLVETWVRHCEDAASANGFECDSVAVFDEEISHGVTPVSWRRVRALANQGPVRVGSFTPWGAAVAEQEKAPSPDVLLRRVVRSLDADGIWLASVQRE